MSGGQGFIPTDVVELGIEAVRELERFVCAKGSRDYWTHEAENAIQQSIPWALRQEDHRMQVIGLRDGEGDLCGVAAWEPGEDDLTVWYNHVVGVRLGYQRRGLGLQLKREVLDRARATDHVAVVYSIVHRDNTGMLVINKRLGEIVEIDPDDPRRRYRICSISL